jgi:hypothetical protein
MQFLAVTRAPKTAIGVLAAGGALGAATAMTFGLSAQAEVAVFALLALLSGVQGLYTD